MTNKEEKKGPQLLDVTDETFEGAKQVRLFLTTHHADRHLLDYHDITTIRLWLLPPSIR